MRVSYLENQLSGNKIEAVFAFRQDQFKLYFESKDISLHASNEAFICCALLPAMASGCAQIDFEGTLSEQFSSNLVLIQALFSKWQKHLKPVNIKPSLSQKKLSHDKVNKKKRVASFFSGGVDSFYTLLKHHEEITDIILVHGFDMPLWNTTLREKTSAKVKQVATHYGKNVIEVETNLRELLDPHEDWLMAHGTALACIGHLLSANFKKIYIPSSYSHEQLVPLGTHPDLDPLWSSEALTFVRQCREASE